MTDLTCSEVHESAAEFALDILDSPDRAAIAAHLLRCPVCREEITEMQAAANQLLDLVPGTEPPVGFEQRVLDRVGVGVSPLRRHLRVVLASAAALIIAVGTALGFTIAGASHSRTVLAEAELQQAGHDVGEVYLYPGTPDWIVMSVHDAASASRVTCEVMSRDGSMTKLGTFHLVKGQGTWGAEYPAGTNAAMVYLIGDTGNLVASAEFT
jgi:hypothetical protein